MAFGLRLNSVVNPVVKPVISAPVTPREEAMLPSLLIPFPTALIVEPSPLIAVPATLVAAFAMLLKAFVEESFITLKPSPTEITR